MSTHFIIPFVVVAGALVAAPAVTPSRPTCCDKHAYCCQTKQACCGQTAPQISSAPAAIEAEVARQNCCAKRAYCCTVKAACCGRLDASAVDFAAIELPPVDAIAALACCEKHAYCCTTHAACCKGTKAVGMSS